MLTFKQFLKESKWDKYVYHATYDPDFKPHEGMHVGSLHAAMSRAHGSKGSWDIKNGKRIEAKPENLKVHAFKYTPSGKSKSVLDPEQDQQDYDPVKLKKQGVSHLTYTNTAEDPGSTSHVVYDTENLKHVHTFDKPSFIKRKLENPKHPWNKAYFSVSKEKRKQT